MPLFCFDFQLSADQPSALLHAQEAEFALYAVLGFRAGIESNAVVPNLESDA